MGNRNTVIIKILIASCICFAVKSSQTVLCSDRLIIQAFNQDPSPTDDCSFLVCLAMLYVCIMCVAVVCALCSATVLDMNSERK